MAEHSELVETAEEQSNARWIHELESNVKFLELRLLYLQKIKAFVR